MTKNMTTYQRHEYVSGKWFECIKPITNVRKGSGCEVGKKYWFEVVHIVDDDDHPTGEFFYRKRSDNNCNDEVYMTDEELLTYFVRLAD